MDKTIMRDRVGAARVGRLATVTPGGRAHVVPCCFALAGEEIVSAVDAKPKATTELQRLVNVRSTPSVALLVDHYDDTDWSQLWWVRVDGSARVVSDGPERDEALMALAAKYPQYFETTPPGPVLVIGSLTWRSWP